MIVIGNGIDSKSMILGSSPGGATMISYNVNDLASIKELIKYIPTDAGIYLFKNDVNGKCYVGQAINLRKRFYTHIYNYKNSKIDNLLYRAFAKYRLINNSTEGGKFFNVINSSFNRIVRTYCEKDSLYKNRYKIIRL